MTFFVSEFDRGLADAPHLICKIIDSKDDGVSFQLACEAGILDRYVARNGFQVESKDLVFPVNRDKMVSVRAAVTELSVCTGQGRH